VCELEREQTDLFEILRLYLPDNVGELGLWAYALLMLATDTPTDRAITYLKDTGSPQHARGRLLLRAAERALREAGDIE
jgi:hypothetical protein